MAAHLVHRSALRLGAAFFALAATLAPANMAAAADARLVRCGQETCLRLSGHRAGAAVAVRVAGHDLAVDGGRSWRATVPLSIARDWRGVSGGMLPLTLYDPSTAVSTHDAAAIPPGALGRHIELATLMVSAH